MKNVQYTIIVTIFLYSTIKLFAQDNITIEGQVLDRYTNTPIANVNIVINNINTTTDAQGYFTIKKLNNKKIRVLLTHINYDNNIKTITPEQDTLINFYLSPLDNPLDKIVVTGTRYEKKLAETSIITQIITAKQIQNRGISNIKTLLMQEIPGVQFQEVGFGTSVDFQGLSGKHLLFLIDGERISGEIGNNIDYNRIPLDNIERIEVVQGASSTLYGSQAMGGVINVITKKPKNTWNINAGLKYTSPYQINFKNIKKDDKYAFFKHSLDKSNINSNINIGINYKKMTSSTHLSYKTTDGYKLYDTDSLIRHFSQLDTTIYDTKNTTPTTIAANENFQISQSITFHPTKKLTLQTKGTYYNAKKYDFNQDNLYEQDLSYTLKGNAEYKHNQKSKWIIACNTDQYERNTRYEKIKNKKDLFYRNTLIQPRLLYYYSNKKHHTIAGIEYNHETLKSDMFANNIILTKIKYNNTAFAQEDWQLNKHINLVGGLRTDYDNNYGWHITPKLSALYTFKSCALRLNYAHGYRSPTLKELHMNWDHLGMFRIYGNKNLQPETNHYTSLSLEYTKSKFYINLVTYYNYFKNKIESQWQNNQTEIHYINNSSATLSGANLNSHIKLLHNLHLFANINYLYPNKKNGVKLTTQSTWTSNTRLEYKHHWHKNQKTIINLIGRYIGEKSFDVLDEIKYRGNTIEAYYKFNIKAYTIFDITITHYFRKHLKITIGINNIFNYKAKIINFNSYISPGINAFTALNYNF